ncbi:LuxR C-terminal-related transcriptional regulator (plasmid) [Alicyclobacillus fastidiosus]|uniref:LuxR C-terminal-related transcriptional regulator n=1 Tax=Alicyclobacillus fastidiosus TaxID=392011 RepID=A0ABY6ZQD9_9BACL|nr:LuxR C-terminal-related transcriptional regulator [Alicyclobacillus fastidiosus]WAH44823.1 LuxR C-terminal-related transcriptional regulator [Alicyclobacillus fastidiosus]GMA65788.1 hypothetical protein GCM10025859_62280 [Alicyclobacillus fastidiosus]
MQDLVQAYQEQIVALREKKVLCNDFETKKQYASMIESLSYAIRQMTNTEYEDYRTILVEPDALNGLAVSYDTHSTDDEADRAADTVSVDMSSLSRRESYVLRSLMDGMTFQEIADDMGLTKSSVQKYAEWARSKLSRIRTSGVQTALFNTLDDSCGVYVSGLFRTSEAVAR